MIRHGALVLTLALLASSTPGCGSDGDRGGTSTGGTSTGGAAGVGGSGGSAGGGAAGAAASGGSGGAALCTPNEELECWETPDGGTIPRYGICQPGKTICGATGTWGPCIGGVGPEPVDECDGVDNDCDYMPDNGDNAECATLYSSATDVAKWSCPLATCVVGTCAAGKYDADGDPSNGCEANAPGDAGTD